MKIVSFYRPVVIKTAVIGQDTTKGIPNIPPAMMSVNPGERIVINDQDAMQIQSVADTPLESITDFWPFYQHFVQRPANFRGKRILWYRGRSGIGDQLIASSLPRFFTEMLKASCFQLSNRMHELFWAANPYINGSAVRFPLSIDSLIRFKGRAFFDWFFPLESVSEFDSEPEQGNVYDRLFAMCGLDPERIHEKYKRPCWTITERDIEELGPLENQSYIAFQLRATNVARNLPVHVVDLVLSVLDKLGMPILCLDDSGLEPDLKAVVGRYKNAVDWSERTPNVRQYGTLISHAQLVVGPDSSAIHFAAASEVPCVALFGSFDPASRVATYPHCLPVWRQELCANSPCFNFMPELPKHKCPDPNAKWCACIDGITAADVQEAIGKLGVDFI